MARKKSSSHCAPDDIEFNICEEESPVFENCLSTSRQDGDYQRWMMDLLVEPKFKEYLDVDFRLKNAENSPGNSIAAHRLILATRNEFFADFLRKEKASEITLVEPKISVDAFRLLICYIYTGRARIPTPVKVTFITSLMFAAAKYQVASLYDLCKDFILRQLSLSSIEPSQIIVAYQSALDLELKDLFPVCCHLLEQRTSEIKNDPQFVHIKTNFVSNLLELDVFTGVTEREIFQTLLRWARIQLESRTDLVTVEKSSLLIRKVMEPFIHKFRLSSIMRDDLTAIITESGVFTEKEQLTISLFLLGRIPDLGEFSTKNRRVLHKQAPSCASVSADSGRESFGTPNLSSARSRMSRSFGNLSRLSVFDLFAPLKKRKLKRDNRPPSLHHQSMQDIVPDSHDVRSRLARTSEATAALSSNSEEFLETFVRENSAHTEPLPPPFVRRVCGIRKKSDQPVKPQRYNTTCVRDNSGATEIRNQEYKNFHIRAIDIDGLNLENKPSTVL